MLRLAVLGEGRGEALAKKKGITVVEDATFCGGGTRDRRQRHMNKRGILSYD